MGEKFDTSLIVKNLLPQQISFLNGLLLGDGSIPLPKRKNNLNLRLTMCRQGKDYDYLMWQFLLFQEFYNQPPKIREFYDKRTNKTYKSATLSTRCCDFFTDLRKKWYPEGFKTVPKDLKLDPITLLIWFLDDGCVVKNKEHSFQLKLSTDGFVETDVLFLKEFLENYFNEKFNVYKNGNGFTIRTYTLGTIKYINAIDHIFPSFMDRKRIWKDFDFSYIRENIEFFSGEKSDILNCEILSKSTPNDLIYRYKISKADVVNIKKIYADGKYSQSNLAKLFETTQSNISSIISGKSHKNNYLKV